MWRNYNNTTAWGEFPPHFYGGQSNMPEIKSIWERKSIYLAIGAGIAGLLIFAFRILAHITSDWQKVLLDGLGVAFVTTFLLALIVDIATRKEILDDVVEASLGYILPLSLRPGMRWIYNQKIVCTQHTQTVEIMPIKNTRSFIVKTTIRRSFLNVSNAPAKIRLGMSIDELFAEGEQSDILNFGYHLGTKHVQLEDKKRKAKNARLVIDTVEEELQPSQDVQIDTWLISQEIRNENDNQSWFFAYATQTPEVTVIVPDSIDYDVGFQYAGDTNTEPILLGNTWKFPMTLLPGHAISIRWWEKEKARQWEDKKQ